MATTQQQTQFWLFLVLGLLVAYVMLVKVPWLEANIQKERESTYTLLGQADAHKAEARADSLYTQWFIDTGAVAKSFELLIPKKVGSPAPEMEQQADPVFRWIESRIRAGWLLLYQLMVRASNTLVWWPFAVLVLPPFIIDAFVKRRIKVNTFDYTSPHLQSLGMRTFLLVLLGYPFLLLAPFVIPAALLPLLIVVVAAATWFSVSHFVKRG